MALGILGRPRDFATLLENDLFLWATGMSALLGSIDLLVVSEKYTRSQRI